MGKPLSRETKSVLFALGFFAAGCALVAALLFTVGLHYTPHYFIAHFLLGLFLPFAFYAMGGFSFSFWLGIIDTAAFHFGYELWEDQLSRPTYAPDFDQIISGALGLVAAWLVYRAWNRRLDRSAAPDDSFKPNPLRGST